MRWFREKPRAFLDFVFFNMLRLNVWGDSLFEPQVLAALRLVGFALLMSFAWEWYSWAWAFFYAFGKWAAAVTSAFVFASAVLVFDRFLIVMDPTRRQERQLAITIGRHRLPLTGSGGSYAMRLAILLMISFITSIPVELRAFSNEIDTKIDRMEGQALNRVRENAKREERDRYTAMIGAVGTNAGGDITQVREEFNGRRQAMNTRHESGRAQRREALSRAEEAARGELHGHISGRQGAGARYRALQDDVSQQREALAAYEAQCASEVETFNRQEQGALTGRRATRSVEVTRLEAERETRLQWIDTAAPEAVARRYRAQGQWKVERGLMARIDILFGLMHEKPLRAGIAWVFRTAMMALGMMIMATKVLSDESFEAYFSARHQARNGNPAAQRLLATRGVVDFEAYARDPHLRDLDEAWMDGCHDADGAVRLFFADMFDMANERDGKGRNLRYPVIRSRLERKYAEVVEPKKRDLFRHAAALKAVGGAEPNWPTELNGGQDPRDPAYKPYDLGRAELATRFNWIDPDPELEALKAARSSWIDQRDRLLRGIATAEDTLARYVRDGLPYAQILRQVTGTWRNLQDILMRMDDLERQIRDGREDLPGWPTFSPDPRPTLERRMQITPDRLRDMGWIDPTTLPPPPSQPPPLPPPVTWTCPDCKLVNPDTHRFCGVCGHDKTALPLPADPVLWTCTATGCNTDVTDAAATECPVCHTAKPAVSTP